MCVSMQHRCLSHQHERSSTEAKEAEAARQERQEGANEGHSRVISGLSAFKEEEGLMERSYQPPEG